jgi:penicillin-binding protein 1A
MRGVVNQGTGQSVKSRFGLVADIAGKTGTTQNNTDGWFILMHPNLVAGSWVGFNDTRVTMRSSYWGQGAHNALLIVGDFFQAALKSKQIDVKAEFPHPAIRAPALIEIKGSDDDGSWQSFPGAEVQPGTGSNAIEPDKAVVVERERHQVLITNAPISEDNSRQDGAATPKSADELSRVMSGMGRDPVSGVRIETVPPKE